MQACINMFGVSLHPALYRVRNLTFQVSHKNGDNRSTSAGLSLKPSNFHLNSSFSLLCAKNHQRKDIGNGDTSKPEQNSFPFENVFGVVFIQCSGSCLVAPIDKQWNSEPPTHQWQKPVGKLDKKSTPSSSSTACRLKGFPVHNQQQHLWKKSNLYCTLSGLFATFFRRNLVLQHFWLQLPHVSFSELNNLHSKPKSDNILSW